MSWIELCQCLHRHAWAVNKTAAGDPYVSMQAECSQADCDCLFFKAMNRKTEGWPDGSMPKHYKPKLKRPTITERRNRVDGMGRNNMIRTLANVWGLLDGFEWTADTFDEIAGELKEAGLPIHQPEEYDDA